MFTIRTRNLRLTVPTLSAAILAAKIEVDGDTCSLARIYNIDDVLIGTIEYYVGYRAQHLYSGPVYTPADRSNLP